MTFTANMTRHCFDFQQFVCCSALSEFGEVNLRQREERTVHAGEFHFVAHAYAARAAHSGTVHHNGVEGAESRLYVFGSGLGALLHHKHAAYRHEQIEVCGNFANNVAATALLSFASIARADYHIVRNRSELVLEIQ